MITVSISGFRATLSNGSYSVNRSKLESPTVSISGNVDREIAAPNIVGSTLCALLDQKNARIEFLGFSIKPTSYYVHVSDDGRVNFSATGIAMSVPSVSESVTDAAKKTYNTWSATGLTRARRAYTFDWGDGDILVVNVRDILGSGQMLGVVMRKDGGHSWFHRNSAMAAYVQRIIFEDGLATK